MGGLLEADCRTIGWRDRLVGDRHFASLRVDRAEDGGALAEAERVGAHVQEALFVLVAKLRIVSSSARACRFGRALSCDDAGLAAGFTISKPALYSEQ